MLSLLILKGGLLTHMMIDLTAPLFCILLGIGSGIGWLIWKKQRLQIRYWLIPLFVCYLLLLMKLTVFPIHIYDRKTVAGMTEYAGGAIVYYQLIPFASIQNYFHGSGIAQLAGNILLLAPMAVFAEIFLLQRPRAWHVALGVSSVSLLIEMLQLVISVTTRFPSRVVDVDDLILNTAGVMITLVFTRLITRNQNIRKVLQKILYR